jgi:hypothetical protein
MHIQTNSQVAISLSQKHLKLTQLVHAYKTKGAYCTLLTERSASVGNALSRCNTLKLTILRVPATPY